MADSTAAPLRPAASTQRPRSGGTNSATPSHARSHPETNQPTIMVTAITGASPGPNGGTMSIRLDPPRTDALQITVKWENGVMSASFQTSSEQTTRLLSHNLSRSKINLESQGVSVDRLHVHQASKSKVHPPRTTTPATARANILSRWPQPGPGSGSARSPPQNVASHAATTIRSISSPEHPRHTAARPAHLSPQCHAASAAHSYHVRFFTFLPDPLPKG